MTSQTDNPVAAKLSPDESRRYRHITSRPRSELRDEMLAKQPTVTHAFIVHLIDTIDGYREALDNIQDRVPSNGVDTSDESAKKMYARVTSLRAVVLREIARLGSATSDDVEASLGMKHQTVSTRFMELRRGGYIEMSERRPTRAGNAAWAHVLTAEGHQVLAELIRNGDASVTPSSTGERA